MLYSGKTGYIKLGATASAKVVAHMNSFSLSQATDIIEIVSFGNAYKEKIPSIKDWTATADGHCDFETGKGQAELYAAYENGTIVTIGLGLTEDVFFEGEAYIESLDIDSDADGSPTVSVSFAGTNGVVFTNTQP